MGQQLFRNATNANAANFTGNIPGVMEISFRGAAAPGAPAAAQNGTDLYTVLLHELGHALGMSTQLTQCSIELLDNDFDIDPNLANGNVFQVTVGGNTGAHTSCAQCLMNPTVPAGQRTLPSATDVLSVATSPNPGWSDIDLPRQDFLSGGTTDWNTASNWVGGQIPGNADDAACRHGVDVPGNILLSMSGNASCRNLLMSGSTSLRTFAHKMRVFDTATIEHDGNLPVPEIFVEAGGELEAVDVVVNGGDLDLNGGVVDLSDDLVLSADTLGRQGNVSGYGTVDVAGTLVNNGRITATDGQTLVFQSANSQAWDLDGGAGDGEVHATTGHLNFASGGLADAFDGTLQVTAPYSATIGASWLLGAGGVVNLTGGNPAEAVLAGGLLTAVDGRINAAGQARVTGPVAMGGSVETLVFPLSTLRMDGVVTVAGGAHLLAADATLELAGPSSISGGSFGLNAGARLLASAPLDLSGGSFGGSGEFAMKKDAEVTIADGYSLDVALVQIGGTLIPGGGVAEITLEDYTQWNGGVLSVQVHGTPGSGQFDHLNVTGTAQLSGRLEVDFNVVGAQAGDTWKILSAGEVLGDFKTTSMNGVPEGMLLTSFKAADGIYLKLQKRVSYAQWAATHNLVPPHDGLDADPDGDGVANGLEMFLGGDPLVAEQGLGPELEIAGQGGTKYLSVVVRVDADVVPVDVWLTGLRSEDLENWTSQGVVVEYSTFDPDHCVEVRRFRSTTVMGSLPKEFMRVEAGYPDL